MGKKAFIAAVILVCLLVGMIAVEVIEAQSIGSIIIDSDGAVIGTSSVQRNGDVYTLIGNLSAGIQIQRSNIIIDGACYTIQGNGGYERGIDLSNGRGQEPSRTLISNVTIRNLKITNCYYAIDSSNTNNNTFIGNYIADCDTGFWITGSSNNSLTYNTVKDCTTGISINYSGKNVITENNIINNSLLVWLSTEPLVDGNYWSNYLTKYPNAKEVENSGLPNLIWDTPYNYGGSLGNFTDNHPLINPVTITISPIPTATPTMLPTLPTPSPTLTPTIVMSASLSESASALDFGSRVNFTVSVEGGKAPYSYAWYVDNQLTEAVSSPYYAIDSIAVGSHHVYVQVTDSESRSAKTLTVEFNILPASSSSVSPSPTQTPTIEPTLTPTQNVTVSPIVEPTSIWMAYQLEIAAIIIIIAVAIVAISALAYWKIKKLK